MRLYVDMLAQVAPEWDSQAGGSGGGGAGEGGGRPKGKGGMGPVFSSLAAEGAPAEEGPQVRAVARGVIPRCTL